MGEVRITDSKGDITDIRLEARGQHYEPVPADPNQSDDGSLNALFTSKMTLNRRTTLNVSASASMSTINGSHLSDGTVFQFNPTEARLTYWLAQPQISLTYELSSTWRYRQAVGAFLTGTVDQPATQLPNGTLTKHRGLDTAQPFVESDVYKDFSDRATGDIDVLFIYSDEVYLLNLSQNPPRNVGPQQQLFLTPTAGLTYRWKPDFLTTTRLGGVVASAPPLDVDQRPILAPLIYQDVHYSGEFWQFFASAQYTYGPVTPRLGSGPSAGASAYLVGTPIRQGHWRDFSVMFNALASHSSLVLSTTNSLVMDIAAASGEIRYAINPTWGLLGGYDFRYATFSGQTPTPPFLRHMVFFGVSGFWTTDKTIPILTQFAAPVHPQ